MPLLFKLIDELTVRVTLGLESIEIGTSELYNKIINLGDQFMNKGYGKVQRTERPVPEKTPKKIMAKTKRRRH